MPMANDSAAPIVTIERIAVRLLLPGQSSTLPVPPAPSARFKYICKWPRNCQSRLSSICLGRRPGFEGRQSFNSNTSTHPVTREFLDNIRIHRLGVGYIEFAFRNRAVALLGKAAPVQRRGQPRIDLQRGVEIGDGVLGLPALQVDQAAAVERIDEIRAAAAAPRCNPSAPPAGRRSRCAPSSGCCRLRRPSG